MPDIALLSIPIEQQQWVEVEVEPPARTGLRSIFGERKAERKKEARLQRRTQWHTFFGAKVPYLTNFLSLYRPTDGPERRDAILRDALTQQLNFLNSMAYLEGQDRTLELRYFFWPERQQVDIVFICKVAGDSEPTSKEQARHFWQHFWAKFPRQVHGLIPIENIEELNYFLNFQADYIAEFRRHEKLAELDRSHSGYVVYPIQGLFNTLHGLWQQLLNQRQPYLISISLRPTHLFPEEEDRLSNIISVCREIERDRGQGYAISAGEVADIYTHYWYQLKQPFLFRLSVASPAPIPAVILFEFASELAHPFQVDHTGRLISNEVGHFIWPQSQHELALAQTNLRYLEFATWGKTIATPPLLRLSQLVGTTAAHNSFRIPVPPNEGLPGIENRSLTVVKPGQSIRGDRNITGVIHIHGPIEGTIVIGGDIVTLDP